MKRRKSLQKTPARIKNAMLETEIENGVEVERLSSHQFAEHETNFLGAKSRDSLTQDSQDGRSECWASTQAGQEMGYRLGFLAHVFIDRAQ